MNDHKHNAQGIFDPIAYLVAIQEAQHAAIQWNLYPGGAPNPDFLAQLEQTADKGDVLLFLCRSGVRSRRRTRQR